LKYSNKQRTAANHSRVFGSGLVNEKLKPCFTFITQSALAIIEALQQCIADVDDDQGGFFESKQWQRLRYLTLQRDRACVLCGATKNLHCDHIKPRSKCPQLEFDPDNLQTLCGQCNLAKLNRDEIDYRK